MARSRATWQRICVFVGLVSLTCIAGCSANRYAKKADDVVETPEDATTIDAIGTERWCSDFGQSSLEHMVQRAWRDNMQLKAAWARLERAEAVSEIASSSLWPSIEAGADASYSNRAFGGRIPTPGSGGGEAFWELSTAASYEVDIWGKLRHRAKAADLETEATEARARAFAITLTSQVAEAWFDVVAQRERIALLEEQLKVSKDVLEITRQRLRRGLAEAVDVSQQEQNIESLRARLAGAKGRLKTSRNRLAVLVGQSPEGQTFVDAEQLPRIEPLAEAGVPANLIERRPDVQAAHLQLKAADERTAAAVADRLPSLQLTAQIGFQAEQLGRILQQLFWSVGGGISQSVFEGGRLNAEIEQSEADAKVQLYEYAQTLLVAMREVRDALDLESSERHRIERLEQQLQTAERTLELARQRYRAGTGDYLQVLTGLRDLQEVERTLVEARRQQVSHRISLCRALGGTWVESVESSIAENDN
jgi:NodT family efflux transporter outer membrane factor (OMF) lipoprotein